MKKRVKVGLALGSGSARGFAHIGVIRVLEAEGIPLDCVAGTSIGAIVGGMYAAGVLGQCEEFLQDFDWKDMTLLLDPLFPLSGLLGGKRIEKLFTSFLQNRRIEDFELPFAAVAADVRTGEEMVLTQGNAVKALRASMSLPGIFTPVFLDERLLVDGGIVSPVPVQAVKALGADVVIGVNLAAEMSQRSYISTTEKTVEKLRELEGTRPHAEPPDSIPSTSTDSASELPSFLRGPVEKGLSFFEERAQALEQWVDEKVERGRAVIDERSSFLAAWLKEEKAKDLPDIFSVLFNSINIMQYQITQASLRHCPADVLLCPDLAQVRLLDFDKVEEAIQEGERIARASLAQIQEAIANA
ncbi:patatin [candidate division KSB3 bacterium]|uniref:Patatin n=1 Tax=candidate division KSB3 bacterium TaxID=2044937 RepID=A0A9D5JSU6_9BACT|nr:patatin [candidate division KSB3 bacterium]MBD3323573.1 patatin [candidate division KSB3 bacterium]